MRFLRGPWRLLLILVPVALTLAACSSTPSDQVATLTGASASVSATPTLSSAQREQLALQFAACVRKNGVPDFPDPTVDQNGNLRLFGNGVGSLSTQDRQNMRTAFQACQQYAKGLFQGFSQQNQQQFQDQILAFAECMRANGYNMPDPTFNNGPPSPGASPSSGDRGGPFGSINRNDPAFQKAYTACQSKLPGFAGGAGGFRGGFGGGGGGSAPSSPATGS